MTNGPSDERAIDVLLVEDSPGDARLLEEYLSEAGLLNTELERVSTLEAALNRLRDGAAPPDVVLLDLGLPDAGGLEAVEAVVEEAPKLPVLVLTGRDDRETAVEALRQGAEDYLLKGEVGPGVLARSIRYAVERKRAATTIRDQGQRFRALIANVTDVISVTAPDGTVLYESPSVERVLGYAPEELEGENILEYIHPDDRGWIRRKLEELGGKPGGEAIGEARFRHADGSWRVLEARGRTPPEGTDLGGIIISSRDVTETREAQQALEESRERFRALAENAADGIVTITSQSRIQYANPAVARMFGYDQEEIVGTSLFELMPEELRERHRQGLARYLDTGERTLDWGGVEFPALRRDGTRLEVEITFGEYSVGGERLFTGLIRDISERKAAQEALRKAQEMFEGVFETSPVALKIVDAETGEYRTVNEGFTEQFGYPREAVEEGAVRDEDLWPDPEMRRRIYDRVARGETVRNVEATLRRKDGSTFDALFSASPLSVEGRRYVVGAIQDISYQKEVERELKHRALHDELTGLPNRALLDDRLRHALERGERTGEALGVCFIDLKRFKVINDSLGHEAGDRVLEEVAGRLRGAVREQDTVARVGGDEFAVLLEDIEGEADGAAVADRIVRAFEAPVELGGREVALEASVGVAVHEGADVERPAPTDLLRWADEAMYWAKEKPGTARAMADPDHPAPDTTRLEREARFREALEAGRIGTVYQPIVGARGGEPRAVEALCRWRDPELGRVPPGTFIPLAEETGLIVQLGEQQLEASCRRLLAEDAPAAADADRPLSLHVNLSSHQLEDPEVVGRIRGVLERTGFPAGRLCLEVTESAVAREPETVDELRGLGVELAIDDFGTQYSTLGQLKRLRVDALKVDRSFVAGLPEDDRDRAIVESVLTLGHALGLTVVAEGVETAEQAELLRELGVDELQGFHLARPMPLEELRAWLEARS